MSAADIFAQNYQLPDATPEQLAFAIARLAYPRMRPDAVTNWFDQLADDTARRLSGHSPGRAMAARFLEVVTQELGFAGYEQLL
ncbi:MAG: hypothetical protein IPK16_00615 [Anaerolineales bacterium]|nr:hypothetical protein [Anaerolineales bacterium]